MPPKRQAADAAASEATTKQPKLSTSAEDSSKPHRCPEKGCEKSYTDSSGLLRHIKSFHQGKKFPCPYQDCSKEYTENGPLQRHIKSSHQGKRLSCPYDDCDKIYRDDSGLKSHINTIHKGTKYSCLYESCDKIFGSTQGRALHLKNHHKGTKYPCIYEACEKIFGTSSARYVHIKNHHKGTKYPCTHESCDKIFDSASGRDDHIRSIHNGVKTPCVFADCPKIYISRSSMYNHIQSVHRGILYSCPFKSCQKVFSTKQGSERHMKIHGTPEELAEIFQQRLELRRFLADKEARGVCSATKACENLAADGSFRCVHHQRSSDIVAITLQEKRDAGSLSESSITSPDEFALLLQRTEIKLDPTAKASLRLLAVHGLSKTFLIDVEFIWVGFFLPLDITIMRLNGEAIISTRVDHSIRTDDLITWCSNPISKNCVRKVYGKADKT